MIEKKTVFLHSMFRAGSTYMFNKFRSYKKFYTYYEPLHHDLVRLQKDSIEIWNYDKKATDVMNHPSLEKPHFYEFSTTFNESKNVLPYYDTDFAYKEFFKVLKSDALKTYIDNLIKTTPEGKIPILQFNRTSLRIDWFVKNYPAGWNVFLLRNPRDQFESYYKRGKTNKNVFLAINLYIILLDHKATNFLIDKRMNVNFSGNVNEDLKACMILSENLTIEEHYKIFYYIWALSFVHANLYADLIIDMDKLNRNYEYLQDIKKRIYDYSSVDVDFQDYRMKNNTNLSMNLKSFFDVENYINQYLSLNNEFNRELLFNYLESLNDDANMTEELSFIKKIIKYFGKI